MHHEVLGANAVLFAGRLLAVLHVRLGLSRNGVAHGSPAAAWSFHSAGRFWPKGGWCGPWRRCCHAMAVLLGLSCMAMAVALWANGAGQLLQGEVSLWYR